MSAINIPKFDPSILISGGGDAELKVWDWLSGKHLGDIPVLSAVQPYIKAKAPPGHRGWHDNTDAGDEKPGRRGKNKKGKGKIPAADFDVGTPASSSKRKRGGGKSTSMTPSLIDDDDDERDTVSLVVTRCSFVTDKYFAETSQDETRSPTAR